MEAILEPPREILHVAHPAGSSGLPADGLLSPLDCEKIVKYSIGVVVRYNEGEPMYLTCALFGGRIPASAAGALLNVVALATASPADRVGLVAALTCVKRKTALEKGLK